MEKQFELYVSRIVDKIDCSDTEKAEIAEEMYDHLLMLKQEFQENGLFEKQAVHEALQAFGEEKKIGKDLQDTMFPYVKFLKSGGSIFCFLIAFLLLKEGFSLMERSRNVDGAGIGVYFLLFEINDRVPERDIPGYANAFFIGSGVMAMLPFLLFIKRFWQYLTSVWTPSRL